MMLKMNMTGLLKIFRFKVNRNRVKNTLIVVINLIITPILSGSKKGRNKIICAKIDPVAPHRTNRDTRPNTWLAALFSKRPAASMYSITVLTCFQRPCCMID